MNSAVAQWSDRPRTQQAVELIMRPIVSPERMRAVDAAAQESTEVLIARAGWAVARSAKEMMGGTYGRRVVVFAGPGNNGADGVVAALQLERWGARCEIINTDELAQHHSKESLDLIRSMASADLVIDACFGTGYRPRNGRGFEAPDVGDTPVLAVDIPSGINGLTGVVIGRPFQADRTLSFVAAKPGLLLWPGAGYVGDIEVADIGLDPGPSTSHWMDETDLAGWPRRSAEAHKWQSSVWVIGGSPGMTGAPRLAAAGAARAGAGYVLSSTPGAGLIEVSPDPIEAVHRSLPEQWASEVMSQADRVGAIVIGPGLSATESTPASDETLKLISQWTGPVVVDAGALDNVAGQQDLLRARDIPATLTPHDGEFARLTGHRLDPSEDRVEAALVVARDYGSVVLLKGPTTIVAHPDGRSWLSTAGDSRLATAGTGDVLAGVIGAGLALGLAPELAATLGAELHGRAACTGLKTGLIASDLPSLVATYLSSI